MRQQGVALPETGCGRSTFVAMPMLMPLRLAQRCQLSRADSCQPLFHPQSTLVQVPLSTPEQVAAAEASPMVVKEGVAYVTKIAFSVHKDVVLGLKFATVVSRLRL